MNTKIIIACFTLWLMIVSCNEQESKTPLMSLNNSTKIDSSRYVVFTKGNDPKLNKEDVQKIYKVLVQCVDSLNLSLKEPNKIDIRRYRFQISYVTDPSNENIVWVNSFCDKDEPNWRKDLVSVKDGGHCFFNLKIDLRTLTFFDLIINGSA